jgi:hypothetical protein
MRILKEESAALIIDVQERLFPAMSNKEETLKNILTLIKGLQLLDITMLATQQYTKGLGDSLKEITNIFNPFSYIEKLSFSCCDEEQFAKKLDVSGCKNLIIAGIEAHVCVLQTTIDLLNIGYIPVIVSDCITSRKDSDKETALIRMQKEGAIITSTESILFELCRYAGTDVFKGISNLVK